mgnify:FL=1
MKPIQLQTTFEGASHRKDGSMTLRFSTQEQTPEEKLIVLEYLQSFGWLMFSPNRFDEFDIPNEQAEDKTKSSSKRLRAVLFLLWKEKGEQGDFEVYYRQQMEKAIDTIKEKLNETN